MAPVRLTTGQIAHYESEGYLILPAKEHKLVDPIALHRWTTEISELPREKGKWMPYDEITSTGQRQLMRTENFVDHHESFRDLLQGRGLADILKQITNDDMLLFKDKINYKLAGGNGFEAHIDAPAYDHIAQIEHTTANFAVDAANLENGCVQVVPGSHKMSVELAEGGRISEVWEASQQWVPVPLASGDLLMFGSHLAHRSAPNKTKKSRASVYATYHMRSDGLDLRSRYYADRRNNFPPDHERIPGHDYEAGRLRYAFAAPFTDVRESAAVQDAAARQPVP